MNDKPSMSTADFVKLAQQGCDVWNEWADANADVYADAYAGLYVNFKNAVFSENISFTGFKFPGYAVFDGATFSGEALFLGAMFDSIASFFGATFSGEADFDGATFSSDAVFSGVTFSGGASFRQATFGRYATFNGATFSSYSVFSGVTFSGGASFRQATFVRLGDFDFVDVQVIADFAGAEFLDIPSFQAVRNPERVFFDTVEFTLPKPASLGGKYLFSFTGLCGVGRSTEDSFRNLRGIANKTHAIDTERDLSILERNAQISNAWVGIKKILPLHTWFRNVSAALTMTPLLVLFRWTSDYGRSVLRPLICLIAAPFVWFVIYLKLYLMLVVHGTVLLSAPKWEALKSLAMFGAFPVGNTLRSTYGAAVETLFGNAGALPLSFQIALTLQSVISLIFIFLIGLALRNFFRLK